MMNKDFQFGSARVHSSELCLCGPFWPVTRPQYTVVRSWCNQYLTYSANTDRQTTLEPCNWPKHCRLSLRCNVTVIWATNQLGDSQVGDKNIIRLGNTFWLTGRQHWKKTYRCRHNASRIKRLEHIIYFGKKEKLTNFDNNFCYVTSWRHLTAEIVAHYLAKCEKW